jgi:recombination protein RecT
MNTQVAEKAPNPVAVLRDQLQSMEGQFKAALPAHIPVERFMRVVMTAIQNNPGLLECERRSLWNSAIRAAQDGLLPDGREGAIVKYANIAQWMPMIAGLRKKVRNSGEIATWDAHVVHANDKFQFRLGDDPVILHEPTLDEPGTVVAAYSIATLKSGEKTREVMSVAAIEKIRSRSKAKNNGPWVTDYEEMCRKTVARRHSKVLPMSTDLDDLIRRDDDLYDFEGSKEDAQERQPRSLASRLDVLASLPARAEPTVSTAPQGGEAEDANESASPQEAATASPASGQSAPDTQQTPSQSGEAEKGADKAAATTKEKKGGNGGEFVPTTDAEYSAFASAWMSKATNADEAEGRWKAEKPLRKKCNITQDTFDELEAALKKRVTELRAAGTGEP